MSTARLWVFLAVALPVMAALIAPLPTVDLTYHLRAGAEMLATGAMPTVDTWTFTAAGHPWTDQQWGSQLLLHGAELVGGWTALAVLRATLIGSIVAILVVIGRRAGLGIRTAALLGLAAFAVASPAMALRPQLLGMVAFALVLLVLALRREHPRAVWAVPLIVLVWANLHGSFFLGPLVAGVAWLQDVHDDTGPRHRLLLVALASVLAACVTPFGPGVWAYAVGLSSNAGVTARISEWQPTSLRTGPGLLFFGSVAAVAVLIARGGARVPWPTLAWLGVFLALGLYTERGVAWWPLAAVPVVAPLLAAPTGMIRAERTDTRGMRRLNAVLAAALAVVIAVLLPIWRPVDPGTGAPDGLLAYAPSGVTSALREAVQPGDHVLAEQTWASWFEYAVPEARYAVDSRIELVPTEVWAAYDAVLAGTEGWQAQLDAWDVDVVAFEPEDAAAIKRLMKAGWTTVYADDEGTMLVRR
jgi:hypothetical protein